MQGFMFLKKVYYKIKFSYFVWIFFIQHPEASWMHFCLSIFNPRNHIIETSETSAPTLTTSPKVLNLPLYVLYTRGVVSQESTQIIETISLLQICKWTTSVKSVCSEQYHMLGFRKLIYLWAFIADHISALSCALSM